MRHLWTVARSRARPAGFPSAAAYFAIHGPGDRASCAPDGPARGSPRSAVRGPLVESVPRPCRGHASAQRGSDVLESLLVSTGIVAIGEIGDKIDVIMVPKVNGPWDIHYVDQLLAQLEAKAGLERPILLNVILGTLNLLPIPPLDGSRVVGGFLPRATYARWAELDRYGNFVFIGLFVVLFTFPAVYEATFGAVLDFAIQILPGGWFG